VSAAATTDAPVAPMERRKILVLLTGLLLAQLVASIEGTVVSTAAPTIVADLGGLKQISWVFTGYLLTSTATTPLWGKLSDLLGRRRLYELAIVIFMVGSVLCGAATSMGMLVGSRILQGIGAGGIFTLTMTIMGDVLPPRERGKYQGYMMSVYATATVLGPLVGGLLVDHAHWRWIFYMNIPLGFAALAISRISLNLPFARREHSIDYLGAALLISWVVAALLVMQLGNDWGWLSGNTLGLSAVAIVALVLFLLQERRAPEPVLPLRLFRERIFAIGASIQFFSGAAMFVIAIYCPLFLQVVAGQKATDSGLLVIPMTLGMLMGSTFGGRRLTRTGRYRWFPVIGGSLITASAVLLAAMDRSTGRFETSAFMLLFGIGSGFIFIVLLVGVQNRVAHEDLGIATSAVNFFRSLGNTIGTAVFGAIFIAQLDTHLLRLAPDSGFTADTLRESPSQIQQLEPALRDSVVQSFTDSLHTVFLWTVPFCLIAFVLAWFVPEHPLRASAAIGAQAPEPAAPRGQGTPLSTPVVAPAIGTRGGYPQFDGP
jgi:EmrB/QacA subfamily drug resistance transporter